MAVEPVYDGGGFPIFKSYHDYPLPPDFVGPIHSDTKQFRLAFADFVQTLRRNAKWRDRFTAEQICAIEAAMGSDGPRIRGFVWHHHQDRGGGVLQLVSANEHLHTFHYGGRFVSGGRP
jgi:hypothetical protein